MTTVTLFHRGIHKLFILGLVAVLAACGGGGASSGGGSKPSSSFATVSSSVGSLNSSSALVASSLPAKSWGEASYLDRVPDSYYGVKNPQLAAGPDGKLTLAWLENGIWVKQYSPIAGWASTPTQLEGSNKIGGVSAGPLVAADNMGNVFVAWKIDAGKISVSRYAQAVGWSPVAVFESDFTVFDFSLAVNNKGDAVLAWSDWGVANRIVAARYTPANGWSVQEQIGSPLINTSFVRVKLNELGDILVGWHDEYATFKYALNVVTYAPASGWSAVQELDRDSIGGSGGQMWPELAVDSANSIWLFWRKQGDIWSSSYSPVSGISASKSVVDVIYPNEIISVAVSASDQGDIRLVWHERFHANLEQVSTKRYLPDSGWGANKVLVATGLNRAPKLTLNAASNAQVIWEVQDGGIHQFDSVYFNASESQLSAVQPVIYSAWGGLSSLSTVVDSLGNRWAAGVVDEGGATRIWINEYK